MNWKHYLFLFASGIGAAATAMLKVDPSDSTLWTAIIAFAGVTVTLAGGAEMRKTIVPGFFLLAILTASTAGCQGTIPPGVVQAGVATLETAICILNVATKDAGQPANVIVADSITQCGTDVATVARVLDAHHAAERAACAPDGGK